MIVHFYKCMYRHCYNESAGNHAICKTHRKLEIAGLIVIGSLSVYALLTFLARFH